MRTTPKLCPHFLGAGQWCANPLPCTDHPDTDQAAACEQTGALPPSVAALDSRHVEYLNSPLGLDPAYKTLAPKPPPPYAPTRRDYFAAAALSGLLAHLHGVNAAHDAGVNITDVAVEYADAIIAALDEVKP